ncbi:hypothetical protein [Nocardiopsis sp. MG754419]|nr:hypothetical protein [Nocardiopsis sp. MG754419]
MLIATAAVEETDTGPKSAGTAATAPADGAEGPPTDGAAERPSDDRRG